MIKDCVIKAVFACVVLGSTTAACTHTQARTASAPSNARQVVDAFFDAMAIEDQEAAYALLADDAQLFAPYNPNGDATDAGVRSFPARLYVAGAMQTYDNLVWVDRKYSLADGGDTLWIETMGKLMVAATGQDYHNRYVFKIEMDDGKIGSITEYTNVATLARDGVTATRLD